MNFKKIPHWILSGIIIFPVLIISGVVLFVLTLGKFNILFAFIIPAIIFESLFETCCYAFSNNQAANIIFAVMFWFIIGAAIGWFNGRLKKLLKK